MCVFSLYVISVLSSVLRKRHTVEGVKLEVATYYPCMGVIPRGFDSSEPSVDIPKPFDIKDINPQVCFEIYFLRLPFHNACKKKKQM